MEAKIIYYAKLHMFEIAKFNSSSRLLQLKCICIHLLTDANWSNLPNSWFSIITSSSAVHPDERRVKPTMSAKRMLTSWLEVTLRSRKSFDLDVLLKMIWSVTLSAMIGGRMDLTRHSCRRERECESKVYMYIVVYNMDASSCLTMHQGVVWNHENYFRHKLMAGMILCV